MHRLSIDKGITLLKIEQASPSKDCFSERFLPTINPDEQKIYEIARFSGNHCFASIDHLEAEKILTSQNSQTLHEMAYFEQKGRGKNAKHQGRTELQQN